MGDIGSLDPVIPKPDSRDDIQVLVTGFGPWRDFPANPSYLIASALPTTLSTASHLPRVQIHTLQTPLRVAYATIRHLIPPLLFPDPDFAHAILPPPPGMTPQAANSPVTLSNPAPSTRSSLLPPPGRPHAESADAILPPPRALLEEVANPSPTPSIPPRSVASNRLPPAGRPHADSAPPALPSLASITKSIPPELLPTPPGQPARSAPPAQPIAPPPPILDSKPNFDLVLFIGMANGRQFYTLETQAHRDGYKMRDVDGKTLEEDRLWKGWGAPGALGMGFVGCKDRVLERWEANVNEDVRLSDDAGHYCCDFLFYTGLVEYWRRRKEGTSGEDAPVAFLHVPGETEEEDVKRGVRVAEGLIRALVETRWGKDKVGGGIVSNVADGLVNMFGRRM